jgi:hypothetical protein
MAMIGHMTETSSCTGIEVVPTADGPVKYACLRPCCTQRRADARAQRTAALAGRDVFARIPQTSDEEF